MLTCLESAAPAVLTENQVKQFITEGFVVVRRAFDPAIAPELVALTWSRLGESPEAPSAALRAHPQLEKVIEEGPIDELLCARATGAVDDLVGRGRWGTKRAFGWVTLRLPQFGGRWVAPAQGWHVDGIDFHHFLLSREQGLVGIEMLTDARPHGGGTVVKRQSHWHVARALHAAGGRGMSYPELRAFSDALSAEAVEITGQAGDVLYMHPHLAHARGPNVLDRVRVAANRTIYLHAPMRLDRAPSQHSAVEDAIRLALDLG